MSRFRKLSQTLWCCQYHIVRVSKYRYRILEGQISKDVTEFIRAFSDQQDCEILELNMQIDHVHLLAMVPPKLSISEYVGKIKSRTTAPCGTFLLVLEIIVSAAHHFGIPNLQPQMSSVCSSFPGQRFVPVPPFTG